jgi:hypothetical protein
VLVTAIVLLVVLTQCVPHVPDVVGLSPEQASTKLTNAGYQVGTISKVATAKSPAGKVAQQTPAAGAIFASGRPVDFVVALGGDLVVVPDLLGSDTPAAELQLSAKQLTMEVAGQYSPRIPAGAVMSQTPRAGAKARVQSQVVVVVSLGAQPETNSGTGSASSAGSFFTRNTASSMAADSDTSVSGCTDAYPEADVWTSSGDIYIRLAPGGAAKQLTSGSGWDTNPTISPSHKYVVFMRAPSNGSKSSGIGRVCLTDFDVTMLSLPLTSAGSASTVSYGNPIFAPSPTGTAPGSDWLVIPQYMAEDSLSGANSGARLLVTNVPLESSWVSWNNDFRPTTGVKLSRSKKPGCIEVTQAGFTSGTQDFNVYTGVYTH